MKVNALKGKERMGEQPKTQEQTDKEQGIQRMPTTFVAEKKDMTITKERIDKDGRVVKRTVQKPLG